MDTILSQDTSLTFYESVKGKFYEGEFVISKEKIYLIASDGQVSEVENTEEILG